LEFFFPFKEPHSDPGKHVGRFSLLSGKHRNRYWVTPTTIGLDFQAVSGEPFLPFHEAAVNESISKVDQFTAPRR
jgi:hypothetical protein